MPNEKLLLVGDHFISPALMRSSLSPALVDSLEITEAQTPFPLEPFRSIAEVREASGSEEQMIAELQGVTLCIAHHAPLTRRILAAAPELRLFVVCRGGPVNVNVAAATEAGVTVCFTPGRNATATAEFAVAMVLAALRGIPAADRGIRSSAWPGDYTFASAGFELEGATCGLVGYGAIGSRVARILKGFGAKVLVHDPYAGASSEDGVEHVELDELLRRSRVVSLHARETAETEGMIGAAQLARMPPGSVLVNCARGALLDYPALEQALRSGHLAAAGADVFPEEPIPSNSPLLSLSNFIMTPHIAGGTQEAAKKAARIAAEELERFVSGAPVHFCANPRDIKSEGTEIR